MDEVGAESVFVPEPDTKPSIGRKSNEFSKPSETYSPIPETVLGIAFHAMLGSEVRGEFQVPVQRFFSEIARRDEELAIDLITKLQDGAIEASRLLHKDFPLAEWWSEFGLGPSVGQSNFLKEAQSDESLSEYLSNLGFDSLEQATLAFTREVPEKVLLLDTQGEYITLSLTDILQEEIPSNVAIPKEAKRYLDLLRYLAGGYVSQNTFQTPDGGAGYVTSSRRARIDLLGLTPKKDLLSSSVSALRALYLNGESTHKYHGARVMSGALSQNWISVARELLKSREESGAQLHVVEVKTDTTFESGEVKDLDQDDEKSGASEIFYADLASSMLALFNVCISLGRGDREVAYPSAQKSTAQNAMLLLNLLKNTNPLQVLMKWPIVNKDLSNVSSGRDTEKQKGLVYGIDPEIVKNTEPSIELIKVNQLELLRRAWRINQRVALLHWNRQSK